MILGRRGLKIFFKGGIIWKGGDKYHLQTMGNLLNKQLRRENMGQDDVIPENIQTQWSKKESQLKELQ